MPAYLDILQIDRVLKDNSCVLPGILIETGTVFSPGSSLYHLWKSFRHVYTIEIVPEESQKAQKAAQKAGATNIEFFVGDSADVLPEVIKKFNEPALFWLDAHYMGDKITGHGKIDPPLRAEINAIFDGNRHKSIIIVDNVGTFGLENLPYENDWKNINYEYITQDIDRNLVVKHYIENDRLIILKGVL